MSRHLLQIRFPRFTHPTSKQSAFPSPSIFTFPSKARAMSSTSNTKLQPSFSSGADVAVLQKALDSLSGLEGGRWRLTGDGMGLERTFKFKTFKKTWEFMNAVATECAKQKHHPEWSNVYSTTFIRGTTHSPRGLSAKDISMAQFCSAQAPLFGVLEEAPEKESDATDASGNSQDIGRALADRVAVEGADCCVPKPKKATPTE